MESPFHIFIIWGGSDSHAYARAFQNLLERCLANVEVFVSSTSIAPGRGSYDEVLTALRKADFAFACIAEESIKVRTWPHFELGALVGREVDVAPILFGGATPDTTGEHFGIRQAIEWNDRDAVYGLVQDLNARMPRPKRRTVVQQNFDSARDQFRRRVNEERERTKLSLPYQGLGQVTYDMPTVELIGLGARSMLRAWSKKQPGQRLDPRIHLAFSSLLDQPTKKHLDVLDELVGPSAG